MSSLLMNKKDSACRLLNTAIHLWFLDSDPVSIHVLALSAYQIIYDLLPEKRSPFTLYNNPEIEEELDLKANIILKKAYNFFKHADKDPEGIVFLNPDYNPLIFLYSLFGLHMLNIDSSDNMAAFMLYYLIHNTDRFEFNETEVYLKCEQPFLYLAKVEKGAFYKAFLLSHKPKVTFNL